MRVNIPCETGPSLTLPDPLCTCAYQLEISNRKVLVHRGSGNVRLDWTSVPIH